MPMIELTLPAGDLNTALTAFRYGADAVYFGMKAFSARKNATNFSFSDLSVIRRYAMEHGKKIYITVNTIVDDESLDHLYALLAQIDFYGCEGLIIQDLGVAHLIKSRFPDLPLHGSTQLAVHTVEGVKMMQKIGFTRVVLSRELTLAEIKTIRMSCPDVELKVFIHGALCYGFSGLCMASYNICGRSANCGTCAQICRSWFTDAQSGENGYFFSMRDLDAGEEIKELDDLGIDSAKVEGRMKDPDYVASVALYYRNILDGYASRKDRERALTSFSRDSSDGYFHYRADRDSLVDRNYPKHVGIPIGTITEQSESVLFVQTKKNLKEYDGLQVFIKDRNDLDEPITITCHIIAEKSSGYIIESPRIIHEKIIGKTVYQFSDATGHVKKENTSLPPYQKGIEATITLKKDGLTITSEIATTSAAFSIEEAQKDSDYHTLLKNVFAQSDLCRYTITTLHVDNQSGTEHPFLPLSCLKAARRAFYDALQKAPLRCNAMPTVIKGEGTILPARALLCNGDGFPWNLEGVEIDGVQYFSFPPVTFNEKGLFTRMEENLRANPNCRIGINNIAQLSFALTHPEGHYFADIYLYQGNRFTAEELSEQLGASLIGGYLWLERASYTEPWPYTPTPCHDFVPPYFISRSCYRHDGMGMDCASCTRDEQFLITQQDHEYVVKCKDCLTVVMRK